MGNVRKSIPKKVREIVYKKYDGHCAYCGEKISLSEMQVDHFIPFYKDGEETVDNYMPACRQCNYYKDTFTLEGFRNNLELIPHRLHNQMFIFRLAEKYGILSTERKPIKFYFETVNEEGRHITMNENCCANCEYWTEIYQKCEHPYQIADKADYYAAMPEDICELYERQDS